VDFTFSGNKLTVLNVLIMEVSVRRGLTVNGNRYLKGYELELYLKK